MNNRILHQIGAFTDDIDAVVPELAMVPGLTSEQKEFLTQLPQQVGFLVCIVMELYAEVEELEFDLRDATHGISDEDEQ